MSIIDGINEEIIHFAIFIFSVKALIRDHHPRDFLSKIEYERMRKRGCKFLKLKYKEEPELEPGEIRKTSKPEDKLMAHVKEVLLEKLELQHAITEKEVDKRWDFEDKVLLRFFPSTVSSQPD